MNFYRAGLLVVAAIWGAPLGAQTDYYNTDVGRPVLIEDAYPVERFAFEAQMAPLRMEREDDGAYHWEFEPELAYGVLPGTHAEVGLHFDFTDDEVGGKKLGLNGVEVALLHNLNVETIWPAFAIAADALIPTGDAAGNRVYPSVKAIATRTFRLARIHLNGQYTIGPTTTATGRVDSFSRWMAGAAIDRALPLHGALLIADVFLEEPMVEGMEREWTAEVGARYQLDPFFALDIGTGRRLTGNNPAWIVTFGAARTFGIASLSRP